MGRKAGGNVTTTALAPNIPQEAELWLRFILRHILKQPLRPAVNDLTDEEAAFMTMFIIEQEYSLNATLDALDLPHLEGGSFWVTEVLPLLERRLNPPPASAIRANGTSFKAVKEAVDIVEVAGEYTDLVPSGKNFKGPCPLHNERTASFYVYPDRQAFHCFGACGRGGDVIELVRLIMETGRWQQLP